MNTAVSVIARTVLALAAVVLPAGCERPHPSTSQPAVVEVSQDPAEIQRARDAWARQQEETLAGALAHPARIVSYHDEILELIRAHRARSLAALTARSLDATETPETRLQAALALRFLDAPASPEMLADLATQSDEAADVLLLALNDLYPRETPLPAPIERFVVAALDHRADRVRTSALHAVTFRGLAAAAPRIEAELAAARLVDDAWLEAAARVCPSQRVLQLLLPRLQPSTLLGRTTTLAAIASLGAHTGDAALRREVADTCIRYLSAQPDQGWLDYNTTSVVGFLAGLQPREEARAQLTRLATEIRWRLVRDSALAELREIDAAAADAIAARLGVPPEDIIREPARPTASLSAWADRCVAAGLLTHAEADAALARARAESGESADETDGGASGALTMLAHAQRFIYFDVETGSFPNRHDRLILDFARASGGAFAPEAVRETYAMARDDDFDGATYTVEFIHAGRLYRVRPKNLGDWYDLEAVIAIIDRALADTGTRERFVCTAADGQCAGFVFGDPAKIRAAAHDLGLELEEDVDSSRRAGIDYEETVRKTLER